MTFRTRFFVPTHTTNDLDVLFQQAISKIKDEDSYWGDVVKDLNNNIPIQDDVQIEIVNDELEIFEHPDNNGLLYSEISTLEKYKDCWVETNNPFKRMYLYDEYGAFYVNTYDYILKSFDDFERVRKEGILEKDIEVGCDIIGGGVFVTHKKDITRVMFAGQATENGYGLDVDKMYIIPDNVIERVKQFFIDFPKGFIELSTY